MGSVLYLSSLDKNILASNDACVRIVGPKPEETQRLARLLIAGRYKADESAKEKDPTSVVERIPDMGGFVLKDVMNQTSLITEFSILSGRGHFTMLFTGDAYGEDILKNVRSWLCVNMREYCLFDVLKVKPKPLDTAM